MAKNIKSLIKNLKQNKTFVIVAVVVILVLIVLWPQFKGFPGVDNDTYQAVFLTNNQVYFGKLKNFNREYITLDNIYYLQASQSLQQGSQLRPEDIPNINLAKLGNELHGPEDRMFIPKERILFWENLKTDSPVVRAITAQNIQ